MSDTQQSIQEVKTSTIDPNVIPVGKLYEVRPDGRWNIYVDHHMISGFAKCESYFEIADIQRVKPRGMSFTANIGIWWAKSLEWYYTALAQGSLTRDMAVHLALDAWDECKIDQLKPNFPYSYEKFGGREGAIVMISQYYDFSYQYDSVHWKVIGVESGFGRKRECLIGENDKVCVYYIGKPDIFIREDKYLMPVDNKTKDYIKADIEHQFKPHAQTAGYIVAAQELCKQLGINEPVDRCLVNVAARNEPSDNPRGGKARKPRFKRVPVHYSVAELQEWREQKVIQASRLRECIETNTWIWNDSACHYYGGCEYRAIHAAPPATRLIVINASYRIAEAWTPYEPED